MLQYEKCSALDHDEISVHDLDDPATLRRLPVTTTTFKIQQLPTYSQLREYSQGVRCEMPTTKAFRRYIAQHGGLLDECES